MESKCGYNAKYYNNIEYLMIHWDYIRSDDIAKRQIMCFPNVHIKYWQCARAPTKIRHTSSLSLPMKSSSGWASYRLPLWTGSSPISIFSIFSCSPWPCPRLGECGWDEKVNTSSCRVSWGSDPSLLSQLLPTCRSRQRPGPMEPRRGSAGEGADPELSLRLQSSEIKEQK